MFTSSETLKILVRTKLQVESTLSRRRRKENIFSIWAKKELSSFKCHLKTDPKL